MESTFTLLADGRVRDVPARVDGDRCAFPRGRRPRSRLGDQAAGALSGRALHPGARSRALADANGVDLAALAGCSAGRWRSTSASARPAWVTSAAERGAQLATLEAPDFTLPDLQRRAALAVRSSAARRFCWSPTPPGEAAAMTCRSGRHSTRSSRSTGSRWSPSPSTGTPRTRARSSRPRHRQHPSLIDTEHEVADLYGMINVPTAGLDRRARAYRASQRGRLRHRYLQGADRLRLRPLPGAAARLGEGGPDAAARPTR